MSKTTRKAKKVGVRAQQYRRNATVMASLLAALGLTSLLLLAMAPGPLVPDESRSLVAVDQALEVDAPSAGWKKIYIHHSDRRVGNVASLEAAGIEPHFVIGNGYGYEDGQIQAGRRWNLQEPARLPGGTLPGDCISICLIGDFDTTRPTEAQMRRLEQLVRMLQRHYGIGARGVVADERSSGPTGIGRQFPWQRLADELSR